MNAVFLLAAGSSLALGAWALAGARRERLQWAFAAGMLALALESGAAYVLVALTDEPGERILWLRILHGIGLVTPALWAAFVTALVFPVRERLPLAWRGGLVALTLLVLAAEAALVWLPAFQTPPITAAFHAARLDIGGIVGVVVQLLGIVPVVAGLEACLRTSRRDERWRVKYLALGLGALFLARFYFLSQVLLFRVLMGTYLTAGAATVLAGNAVAALAFRRARLGAAEIRVSRHVVYGSVVVVALGLYLLTVGVLGWVLNHFGIPEELLWSSLLVFVSAIGLAAFLLSENVRWRVKRFIALNFYRSKYDYREQWGAFTRRLGSRIAIEELVPELLAAVTSAAGAARGALYVADARGLRFHLAGQAEADRALPLLPGSWPPLVRLAAERRPFVIENGDLAGDPTGAQLADSVGASLVLVPIDWQGTLTGVMIVGPERTGAAYTPEDLEFLLTVGEQAAGLIVTARLTESLARGREFEAFHRLTSFVIHDIKNSVTAISMLSRNALEHFDDPEFQKDAVRTLSVTVERMKALLARLSQAPEMGQPTLQAVDLAALALEAIRPLSQGGRVAFVKDLAPVPSVPGEQEALLKVIQNLVTNAVEAIPGEGTVTVRTFEEDRHVVLTVSDTGCGMSEAFVANSLFAPFRSTKKSGWGIGLYQAWSVVEGHGGSIDVASREGQGTTFAVRLPREGGA